MAVVGIEGGGGGGRNEKIILILLYLNYAANFANMVGRLGGASLANSFIHDKLLRMFKANIILSVVQV